ncbi:MAG: CHAT domain-containing protein [Gammaproteobacteria bacterium]|nr:CHAT domain-containing protein [Gammaproteobacteria bacterium]
MRNIIRFCCLWFVFSCAGVWGQDQDLGLAAFDNGDYAAALFHWQGESVEEDSPEQAENQARQAAAYQKLGDYGRAFKLLDSAWRTVRELPLTRVQGVVLLGLMRQCGLSVHEKCDLKNEGSFFHQGQALVRRLQEPKLEAQFLMERGNAYAREPSYSRDRTDRIKLRCLYGKMLTDYQRAAELAELTGDRLLAAQVLNNMLANLSLDREADIALAKKVFQRLHNHLQELPPNRETNYLWLNAGRQAKRLAKYDKNLNLRAHILYSQALRMAEQRGDVRAESFAWGYLGELYGPEDDNALQAVTQAIYVASRELGHDDLLLRWHRQQGRLYHARNNLDLAVAAYTQAIRYLENLRQDIEDCREGTGYSFAETIKPLYMELADVLLLRAAQNRGRVETCDPLPRRGFLPVEQRWHRETCGRPPSEVFRISQTACDLSKARETLVRLRENELQDYFQDACVTRRRCMAPLQTLRGDGAVLIYYAFLPQRVAVLVDSAQGLRQLPLKVKLEDLKLHVDSLLRLMRTGSSSFLYAETSNWLYQALIKPLEKAGFIVSGDELVFAADEYLRQMPMAVLRDGDTFLVEKYATAVAPGMVALRKKHRPDAAVHLLLSGFSLRHGSYWQLPPLDYVAKELEETGKIFAGRNTLLLNGEFTFSGLKRALQSDKKAYRIVHIASHTFFEGDSRESIILTGDDPEPQREYCSSGIFDTGSENTLNMNDLEALIHCGARNGGQSVELLSLNACATSVDEERAALGLAGLAVKAGVPSVIGTLWKINDQAAELFSQHFYQLLKQNQEEGEQVSKAELLRQTQRFMLEGHADEVLRNPYFWGPFLLVGDWR